MSNNIDAKTFLKCSIVFFFSLAILMFFGMYINSYDAIWNYGFSYSIALGEVPYRDFTMIIPPLYNFIMSIGLIVFSHDNLVFLIEQALLISLTFYFLYKMYEEKAWFFLVVMCFPLFYNFAPSYNYFLFFLAVVLIYCEKFNKNDYLIGVILASMLLTKYTTGAFLILPSLISCFKDRSKLLKRLVGIIIPCSIFLIYLIFNNALYQFFDLCFLGLFDFAQKNTELFTNAFFVSLVLFLISIYLLIKDKKNIIRWIAVLSYFIIFPNVSPNHLYTYTLFFSLNFISSDFVLPKKYIYRFVFIIILILMIDFCLITNLNVFRARPYGFHNFKFYLGNPGERGNVEEQVKLYSLYEKKGKTYFLSSSAVWSQIINEEDTNYFTILNKGNFGYNGTKKMINKIKSMHDVYFIIDLYEYKMFDNIYMSQFDVEIIDYIVKKGKRVDSGNKYDIYYID